MNLLSSRPFFPLSCLLGRSADDCPSAPLLALERRGPASSGANVYYPDVRQVPPKSFSIMGWRCFSTFAHSPATRRH